MNVRNFVSGSSVILVGWLGATFLNEVPSQRYPKLDKSNSARAGQIPNVPSKVSLIEANPNVVVSTSR